MEKQTIEMNGVKITVENQNPPLYKGGDDPPVSWQLHTLMNQLSFVLQQDYAPHLIEDEMVEYLERTFIQHKPKDEEGANLHLAFIHQIASACGQFADALNAVDSSEEGARYVRYNSRRLE